MPKHKLCNGFSTKSAAQHSTNAPFNMRETSVIERSGCRPFVLSPWQAALITSR